jgi:hypothetical protein
MNVPREVWTRPALLEQVLRRRRDGRAEVALRIAGLAQPRRAMQLEQVLHALPGVAALRFEVAAQRAHVPVATHNRCTATASKIPGGARSTLR